MPSTPRFKTPARSTTSSPDAASNNGVEAATTVSRTASTNSMGDLWREDEAEAVEDERVAGEHEEQHDALEHLGEIERDLERDLRAFATDEGERQEQRRHQNADGMQAAEEGDDDRREAVAGRDVRLQMIDGRRNLDDAGKPGERAGDQERHDGQRLVAEAREARRARGPANQLDLEALQRAAEHDGHSDHHQ